jgi:hypothetical protein
MLVDSCVAGCDSQHNCCFLYSLHHSIHQLSKGLLVQLHQVLTYDMQCHQISEWAPPLEQLGLNTAALYLNPRRPDWLLLPDSTLVVPLLQLPLLECSCLSSATLSTLHHASIYYSSRHNCSSSCWRGQHQAVSDC